MFLCMSWRRSFAKPTQNDYEGAKAAAKRYKDLFGEDYYIELQDHGLEEQKEQILI